MLRINLLPPYIYDKQKKVRLGMLWAAIVAGALGLFLFWLITLNQKYSEQKDLQTKAEGLRTDYEKAESDIKSEENRRAQIEKRQVFIAAAQKYNDSWPAAMEMMRAVTADNILLKTMAFDAGRKTISLTGFAKTETDIVKWWMYLRNNYAGPDPALPFDNVAISLPKHPWPPAGTATAGANGLPGGFGGPGSGGGGSAGGASMASMATMSTFGGKGGSPGGGPGGPGGGAADAAVGPGVIEGRPGINFTASLVLKKALADGIATPAWGGGGAPAGPSGFGGPGISGPGGGGMPGSGGAPGSAGRMGN